jgi:hypothetical protein
MPSLLHFTVLCTWLCSTNTKNKYFQNLDLHIEEVLFRCQTWSEAKDMETKGKTRLPAPTIHLEVGTHRYHLVDAKGFTEVLVWRIGGDRRHAMRDTEGWGWWGTEDLPWCRHSLFLGCCRHCRFVVRSSLGFAEGALRAWCGRAMREEQGRCYRPIWSNSRPGEPENIELGLRRRSPIRFQRRFSRTGKSGLYVREVRRSRIPNGCGGS